MKDFVDDSKAFCPSGLTCSSVISLRLLHSEGDPDSILSSPVDCQSPVDLLTCLHACHSRSHLGIFCKSFNVLFFVSSCKGLDLYLSPCSELQHCLSASMIWNPRVSSSAVSFPLLPSAQLQICTQIWISSYSLSSLRMNLPRLC